MIESKDKFLDTITVDQRKFIADCIKSGLADYDNSSFYSAEARRYHTPSLRAAIRNCHIVAHAERSMLERSDIQVKVKSNRVLFIVSNKIRISFKKFDKNLRTSNYPTRQARAFGEQNLFNDTDFPDKMTNVFAGYRHNSTETDYELFITCPLGKENEWYLKLSGTEDILDLFSTNASSAAIAEVTETTPKRRVRIRSEALRKDIANE